MAELLSLIFLSVLVGFVTYMVYVRVSQPLASIPGPFFASLTRLWLVHQTRTLQRHRLEIDLHKKYGKVVRISPNEISIADPKYFKMIYGSATHFSKSSWYDSFAPKNEDGMNLLGESSRESYQLQRRLIGPIFTTPAIKKHESLLDRPTLRFVSKMKETKGQPQDLVKWMNILAIDLLTELTFGNSMGLIDAGEDQGNTRDIDDFWKQVSWMGLLPYFRPVYVWAAKSLEAVGWNVLFLGDTGKLSIIKYYIAQITARRAEDQVSSQEHADLASDIVSLAADRPEFKPQWGATLTLHIMGAGFDTLGTTLATCLVCISRLPGCITKIHKEIDQARNSGHLDDAPSYEQALALPYLQTCITEAMRLHSVIGISLPRTVPPDGVVIEGHHIPGGTVVGMNPRVIHRDEEIYGSDADTFRPERYIEASKEHRNRMDAVSFAFGGPSRSCPGRYLAWVVLSKALAAIFLHFEVELAEKQAKVPAAGDGEECFFMVKWYGMWVHFKPRG